MEIRNLITLAILAFSLIAQAEPDTHRVLIPTANWQPGFAAGEVCIAIASKGGPAWGTIVSKIPILKSTDNLVKPIAGTQLGLILTRPSGAMYLINTATGKILANFRPGFGAANLQDVVALPLNGGGFRLYLSTLNSAYLSYFDITLAGRVIGEVQQMLISSASDPELSHLPEAGGMFFNKTTNEVVVLLAHMDQDHGWLKSGPSEAVMINPFTNQVSRRVTLKGWNPLGAPQVLPNGDIMIVSTGLGSRHFYVEGPTYIAGQAEQVRRGETPFYDGIVEIWSSDFKTFKSGYPLEKSLKAEVISASPIDGRYLTVVASVPDYTIVTAPKFTSRVVRVDLQTGEVKEIAESTTRSEQSYVSVAADAQTIYVAKRDGERSGVYAYSSQTLNSMGAAINTTYAPYWLANIP